MNKFYLFLSSLLLLVVSSCKKDEVSTITINKESSEVLVGFDESLVATVQSNADKTVTWSSNNPDIAVVSSSGVITGKKKGTVKIKASIQNGRAVASCDVLVQELNDQVLVTPNYLLTTTNGISSQESYFTLVNKTNYPVNITTWYLSNLQGIFISTGNVNKSIPAKENYNSVRISTLHDPWKMSHELHVLPISIDITFEKNKYGISLTESADGKITQTMVKF